MARCRAWTCSPPTPAVLAEVVGDERVATLARRVESLGPGAGGPRVINVNSTASGGGVAEMLHVLLAYARGGGVDARWSVIEGDGPVLRPHQADPQPPLRHPGDGGPLGPDGARPLRGGAPPPTPPSWPR